jgi:hypothetical protein
MTEKVKRQTDPAGGRKTIKQALLETGADFLQDTAPVSQFDIYVAGFHCAKGRPDMQMHAHHYCRQINADLMQCVLFDGNTADANLISIEYIVSERLFETLPSDERRFWHPHNFEVLSGTLVARSARNGEESPDEAAGQQLRQGLAPVEQRTLGSGTRRPPAAR